MCVWGWVPTPQLLANCTRGCGLPWGGVRGRRAGRNGVVFGYRCCLDVAAVAVRAEPWDLCQGFSAVCLQALWAA